MMPNRQKPRRSIQIQRTGAEGAKSIMNALKVYVGSLRRARSRFVDDETRLVRAFDAGYVLLLDSAEESGLAKPVDHPSASQCHTSWLSRSWHHCNGRQRRSSTPQVGRLETIRGAEIGAVHPRGRNLLGRANQAALPRAASLQALSESLVARTEALNSFGTQHGATGRCLCPGW